MNNKEAREHQEEMNRGANRDVRVVAIGYLDITEPFEKGAVPKGFLDRLRKLYDEGMVLGSLGHHDCEFCIKEGNYEGRATSSSEKILTDEGNGVDYIFPEMIFHYIKKHNFKPSDEFIAFVMGTCKEEVR